MKLIQEILMKRDGITKEEADILVENAKKDFYKRLNKPKDYDDVYSICEDHFGLELGFIEQFF